MVRVQQEEGEERGLRVLLTATLTRSHPIIINVCLMVNQLQSSLYILLAISSISLLFLYPVHGRKFTEDEVRVSRSNSLQAIISAV